METSYIALGTLLFVGSILALTTVLSLLRRRRFTRLAQAAVPIPSEDVTWQPEETTMPSVLPFIPLESPDDTQPFAPTSDRRDDFIPITAEIDDEEPTHPTPPPHRVIEHDPDQLSITIQPDAKAPNPQRVNIARLIAHFESDKTENVS